MAAEVASEWARPWLLLLEEEQGLPLDFLELLVSGSEPAGN